MNPKAKQTNSNNKTETNNKTESASVAIMIENNIPIPARRSKTRYPFGNLQPGQSFIIPREVQKAGVTVNYWKKKLQKEDPNIDFTIRGLDQKEFEEMKAKLPEGSKAASRVWRVDGAVLKK